MVNSWGSGGHRPIESRVKLLGFHLPRWDDPPRPHSQKWPHFLTPFLTLFPKSSNFEAWNFSHDLKGLKKGSQNGSFWPIFGTPFWDPFFDPFLTLLIKMLKMSRNSSGSFKQKLHIFVLFFENWSKMGHFGQSQNGHFSIFWQLTFGTPFLTPFLTLFDDFVYFPY